MFLGHFIHVSEKGRKPSHYIVDWERGTVQWYGCGVFTVPPEAVMTPEEAEAFVEKEGLVLIV